METKSLFGRNFGIKPQALTLKHTKFNFRDKERRLIMSNSTLTLSAFWVASSGHQIYWILESTQRKLKST
jgi:hypothetical protein